MAHTYRANDYFPSEHIFNSGGFSHLDETDAVSPGALVYCQNLHYLQLALSKENVACILCPNSLKNEVLATDKTLIYSDDPRADFFHLYKQLAPAFDAADPSQPRIGSNCNIHPAAVISPSALLGENVEISANVVIESNVVIGDNVYIGSNAVVGAEGLITLRGADGVLMTVRHQGGVKVGNGCQILAGAVIAKALFQTPTTIGENCQIGIMANIGHGVVIGKNSVISGNTVVAGRTRVGEGVWMGTSCSVAQGLVIGDGAQLKMGSVVITSIAAGQVVSGNFAINHRSNMTAHLRKSK
ncbi:hypothetical protein K9857_23280 [Pseudomonas sp. REP124]|uniref:DapH/DapD/GlmU-related protein n=1 Tax=Pseudomonas sp. REP124 TaxID=2875731 RepID=UPI001CC9D37F|nr:DapH/DapD/GlmU-related protein [Pseudomonas sp. REP124]MBZ9784465.1 hypothetical protein [Pseudomonas sp. REP124]